MLHALEIVGFVWVIVFFAVALYARHQVLKKERRPGYLIEPGEPGSDYEIFIDSQGRERCRPTATTRERWARED